MALAYKPPTFEIKPFTDEDIVYYLHKKVKKLVDMGDMNTAYNLGQYLNNRHEYINKYSGMYAQITPNGINITDKTSFNRDDFSFNNGPGGLLMKIGSEIESNNKLVNIMYKFDYPSSVQSFCVPIKFGDHNKKENWDERFEAIVDTGCTVTTFDESVMTWLKNVYPSYTTVGTQAFVVGGPTVVDRSYIDIEFCGKLFERHNVHFAKLSSVALIGTDILNHFKLDIDSGTRISITYH